MERAGVQTERGDELRAIQERNQERERERLRVEFEQRMERAHQKAREMGFEEREQLKGTMTSKAEAGVDGRRCVMVANATTKHYALVELEHVRRVEVTQDKAGTPKLTWKPVEVSELVKDVKLEVVKEAGQVHVYQGLSAARERLQQLERERAEQEEQARERERARLREEQREREERERQKAQALKREVEAQEAAYREAGWVRHQLVYGEVASVKQVGDARVVVVASEYSKTYAVMISPEERTASVKVNEKDKAELVMESAATPLKRGDSAHCDVQKGFVCRDYSEASFEQRRMQRQMDRDKGWER
jgi:hypothetical protein